MSSRLNQEREADLQPQRLDHAKKKLSALGYELTVNRTTISFLFKGNNIMFFPYSGWFSGKGIKDGRGLKNLLKQLQ